jgi:hypothetical protein
MFRSLLRTRVVLEQLNPHERRNKGKYYQTIVHLAGDFCVFYL